MATTDRMLAIDEALDREIGVDANDDDGLETALSALDDNLKEELLAILISASHGADFVPTDSGSSGTPPVPGGGAEFGKLRDAIPQALLMDVLKNRA